MTRRVDFALFMVEARENDELVYEAPAIVGCQTPTALAQAASESPPLSNRGRQRELLNLRTDASRRRGPGQRLGQPRTALRTRSATARLVPTAGGYPASGLGRSFFR
jgi:hypothetical protein